MEQVFRIVFRSVVYLENKNMEVVLENKYCYYYVLLHFFITEKATPCKLIQRLLLCWETEGDMFKCEIIMTRIICIKEGRRFQRRQLETEDDTHFCLFFTSNYFLHSSNTPDYYFHFQKKINANCSRIKDTFIFIAITLLINKLQLQQMAFYK